MPLNRRGFLTRAIASGIAVVSSSLWIPTAKDTFNLKQIIANPTAIVDDLATVPMDYIWDITMCGKNERSEIGRLVVSRNDLPLLDFNINTYGGILRWVPVPGMELRGPLLFTAAGNMTINFVGSSNGEIVSRIYDASKSNTEAILIPMMKD